MNCHKVPAELYTVHADNGDPLLIYGTDAEGWLVLMPFTKNIDRHKIAFGRFCKRNIGSFDPKKVFLQHELCEKTLRWMRWLGVELCPS